MGITGVDSIKKTTDAEIRQHLIEYLSDKTRKVIEEFDVENGVSRADLVDISNDELHGYEIKSDVDSLTRLPSQVHSYNKVFSKMTLVVGIEHVKGAMYLIPEWWGVVLVKYDIEGNLQLSRIRKASPNPRLDTMSLLNLLFKEEISVVIRSCNVKANYHMTKASLSHQLLDHLKEDEIHEAVTTSLLRRYCS